MATATRTPIATLSTGIEYPLAAGTLIRRTEPSGRTDWEVRATARSPHNLSQGVLYPLSIVAEDGQSYFGSAWLQNQIVRNGVEWSHVFLGNGELGLGARMPVPPP